MTKEEITKLFNEFLAGYDVEKHRQVWIEHQKTFREFWKTKILTYGKTPLSEAADYDPIIRIIDVKARGFNKETDEAVAHVGLYQGVWYRIFNDLKEQDAIRTTTDKIFKSDEDRVLIEMINRLEKENEKNKNGLTGRNANALNALLFINNPDRFLSSVSLSHRFQLIEAFDFGNPETYKTYGEKVIKSNSDILSGFKEKFGIEASPRTISMFIYLSPAMKALWKKDAEDTEGADEKEVPTLSESEFAIEKHLEDFLVANWESTELGKLYDLIEEDGEMVSQQYPTKEIGNIDLLVRDKKKGDYVVIELKKGQTSDDTIGQLTRYMGWVKRNKAGDKKVRGIVIAGSQDERLRYALEMVPDTKLFLYRISFSLEKPKEK